MDREVAGTIVGQAAERGIRPVTTFPDNLLAEAMHRRDLRFRHVPMNREEFGRLSLCTQA